MRPQWDLVVVGGANLDFLTRGPRLPGPGESVEGGEFQEAPGGKGANQAVAAARLGARTAFVGRLGRDRHGDTIAERLRAEGVDLQFLSRDDRAPTGIAVIQVDQQGRKQIQTAPGANLRLSPGEVAAAAPYLRDSRVVLTQLEAPAETALAAARIGRSAGARVVFDPAPPTRVPDELLRLVDVIRPNSAEAAALTGIKVRNRASARRAAAALLDRGAGMAVVATGDGNLMLWREGEHWLPHIPVESLDQTGAGDAFAAGLAVALAEDRSPQDAGRFASAAAALATTKLGAQASLPTRQEVLALLAGLSPPTAGPAAAPA